MLLGPAIRFGKLAKMFNKPSIKFVQSELGTLEFRSVQLPHHPLATFTQPLKHLATLYAKALCQQGGRRNEAMYQPGHCKSFVTIHCLVGMDATAHAMWHRQKGVAAQLHIGVVRFRAVHFAAVPVVNYIWGHVTHGEARLACAM